MNIDLHNHRTQLVLTALAASAATAGLLSAFTTHSRRLKRLELDRDVKRALASGPGLSAFSEPPSPHEIEVRERRTGTEQIGRNVGLEYDEELVREQLARNYVFFGEEGMAKIRKGRVVIVGCGGVGSWAAVMLVRSCVRLNIPANVQELIGC